MPSLGSSPRSSERAAAPPSQPQSDPVGVRRHDVRRAAQQVERVAGDPVAARTEDDRGAVRRPGAAGCRRAAGGPVGRTDREPVPHADRRRPDPAERVGRPRAQDRLDGDPTGDRDVGTERRSPGDRGAARIPGPAGPLPRSHAGRPSTSTPHLRAGDRDPDALRPTSTASPPSSTSSRRRRAVADEPVGECGAPARPARQSGAPPGAPTPADPGPAPARTARRRRPRGSRRHEPHPRARCEQRRLLQSGVPQVLRRCGR